MTFNARTLDYPSAPQALLDEAMRGRTRAEPIEPFIGDPSDRKVFAITMAVVLALYLLLQNQYWVPAGDSELYTAAARSLARGEGYTFNGQPVAIIPPGWSWMM